MSVQLYTAKRAFVPPPSLPAAAGSLPNGLRPLGFLTIIATSGEDRLAVGHDTALGASGRLYAVALDRLGSGGLALFDTRPICAAAARDPETQQLLDRLEDQGLALFLMKQCPVRPTPLPPGPANASDRLHLQFEDLPGQVLLRGIPSVDDSGAVHAWLLGVSRQLRPQYLTAPLADLHLLVQRLNAVVTLGALPALARIRRRLYRSGRLLLAALAPIVLLAALVHFYLRQPLQRLSGYRAGWFSYASWFGGGGGVEPIAAGGLGASWLFRIEHDGFASVHLVNPLSDVDVRGARTLIVHYAGGPARDGVWEIKLKDRNNESKPWLLPGTGSSTTFRTVEVDLADPRFSPIALDRLYAITLATNHARLGSDAQQTIVPLSVQRLEFR